MWETGEEAFGLGSREGLVMSGAFVDSRFDMDQYDVYNMWMSD